MSCFQVDEDFECGNIRVLEQSSGLIRLSPRSKRGEPCTLWFAFRLRGAEGSAVRIAIENPGPREYLAYFNENVHPWYSLDGKCHERVPRAWLRHGSNRITLQFTMPATKVFISYGMPYSTHRLNALLNHMRDEPRARVAKAALTEEGRPVYVIHLSDGKNSGGARPGVVVTARMHAGEAPASHVCESIVDSLLASTDKARSLLRLADWCIIPIIDVDGVVNGLNGKFQKPIDFNSDWKKPSRKVVKALKEHLDKFHQSTPVRLLLDLHSPVPFCGEGRFYAYAVPPAMLSPRQRRLQALFLQRLKKAAGERFDPELVFLSSEDTEQTLYGHAALDYAAVSLIMECPFHKLGRGFVTPGDWAAHADHLLEAALVLLRSSE